MNLVIDVTDLLEEVLNLRFELRRGDVIVVAQCRLHECVAVWVAAQQLVFQVPHSTLRKIKKGQQQVKKLEQRC